MTKPVAITLLVLAEILAMALWFTGSAVVGDMAAQTDLSPVRQAFLASGVQFGFALGALIYAILGLADRFDPRRVFAASALAAAAANTLILVVPVGSMIAIALRCLTGGFLAGVYPVGMKIAAGWGTKDRGFLVGLLVGALTLGSAVPYFLAFLGGTNWRVVILGASALATIGALIITLTRLGPNHGQAVRFEWKTLSLAWTDRRIRYAYIGYLGHMWELYAFWAWISVALTLSFTAHMDTDDAQALSKLTAFCAIGLGTAGCILGGLFADRFGKAELTIIAMGLSGSMALITAAFYNAAPAVMIICVLIWGFSVIADSAQFSALVADVAPAAATGSLLTFQTALGFALTTLTVQAAPWLAGLIGWRGLFVVLALGPLVGILAMAQLRRPAPSLSAGTKTP
ncbi:MAG: MFS transporter [Pseudomonadota bacterium]